MPSPSKAKGSNFEREVAAYLSDKYGETFIRNISGSGAYVGGSNNLRKLKLTEAQIRHAKGDIVPPESFPKFNAECKFYGDFGFHQLFTGSAMLESWLKQLLDASDDDDLNILFMKFNRKGRYVAVQATCPWNTGCNYMRYTSATGLGEWMIYDFENFFNLNTINLKNLSSTKTVLETLSV